MKKVGRPRKNRATSQATIALSAKIHCEQSIYQFVKDRLQYGSKTDLILEALKALYALENGELYAKFIAKVLPEIDIQKSLNIHETGNQQNAADATTEIKENNTGNSLDDLSDNELIALMDIIAKNQ